MLNVVSVSKKIGSIILNDDINISIPQQSLTCIMGPNGAGKSTLMSMMSGENSPCEGLITWRGKDIHATSAEELAKDRAVLTQRNQISFGFSVRDVIMMGRLPWSESKQDTQRILHLVLGDLGLERLADRSIHSLSGGEMQRVALARALCQIQSTDTSYLLLDEPTAALDVSHAHDFLKIVKTRCASGMTGCVILHDFSLALRYADFVVLMSKGRIVAEGAPLEVFSTDVMAEVFGVVLYVQKNPHGGYYICVEPN